LVWVVRHGETEWSRNGCHTSRTDLDLTPEGKAEALRLRGAVSADLVLCSPRLRARRTAELAGLTPFEVTDDLREWDYGAFEGLTTPQIQETYPGWTIWDGPWPGGETAADVAGRADRLLKEVVDADVESVALVGHGHFSRVLATRWVGEEVAVGRWLDLDTGTLSQLGWYKELPVVCRWNAPV
jgi:probable phosphoglycerate mutase